MPPRSASRSDLPPRSVEERGGKGVRGEGAGEEERKRRKERGSGRAKRARWCEEAWEEGRGAKRAREAQGRAKRQQNLTKSSPNLGYLPPRSSVLPPRSASKSDLPPR